MSEEKYPEIIELFKKYNLKEIRVTFEMGGDSGDLNDITYTDKNGNDIDIVDDDNHIRDAVYDNITFYEASNGYYSGENGTVIIELDEDDNLTFAKTGVSIYNESYTEEHNIEFTKEENQYINKYIKELGISGWNGDICLYNTDFILTEELEEIDNSIKQKLASFIKDFVPNMDVNGEITNSDNITLKLIKHPNIFSVEFTVEEERDLDE